jgi:type VI secretion system secreted protein Hcp
MRRRSYLGLAVLPLSAILALAVALLPFVLGLQARAADVTQGEMYVDFGGTGASGGEAVTPDFEVLSYSFGASSTVSIGTGGVTTGRPNGQDLSIQKKVDDASPLLFQALVSGDHYPTLVLIVNENIAGVPTPYLEYSLTNAFVDSWQDSGSEGGGVPIESVSFAYTQITLKYAATDPSSGQLLPFRLVTLDLTNPTP